MSINTKLQINSCWEINDIINVLTSNFELKDIIKERIVSFPNKHSIEYTIKVDVHSEHEVHPGMFTLWFTLKNSVCRQMFVYLNSKSPLGSCTLLSLGGNEEAIKIMTKIAKTLGGYLMENDCDDSIKEFTGDAD